MRSFRLVFALAVVTAACGTEPRQDPLPLEGDEAFTSATPGGGFAGGAEDAAMTPSANARGGTARTVEEGDIYKLAGNTLYILNAYRGLQIVDVTDPDRPVLRGTSPIFGHPVEMYFRGGYAYVVVSDYFTYWQVADGGTTPFHGSQIRIVDVRAPDAPVVVGGIDIEGAVSDTRIVGDVLYAVSTRWAWYSNGGSTDNTDSLFVASIDLANPAAPHLVETLSFPGSTNEIHVSPTTLYVASPDGDWQHPRTNVTVVDIDDPQGDLETVGSYVADGWVDDRFQLDEFAGTFRLVTHTGSSGQDGTQRLTVFDLGGAGQLSTLELPNTGGLFATRFAGDRAYLVTMVTVDPLEVIDLRDPTAPVLTHSLVIPGVLHHLEIRGDRLLALGTDSRWNGVAASLFDVADPRAPALLSRIQVGGGSSWSNANWDDKALKVLDDQGLMLVPFQSWDSQKYVNGFQLIEFTRTSLRARGVVEQEGTVSRLAAHQSRLLSISDRVLQSIDATDRDHPVVKGRVELARDVLDLAVIGGRAVTLSSSGWSWETQSTDLRVAPLARPEGTPIGAVKLPFQASRLIADGQGVIVLGWPSNWDGTLAAARVDLTNPAAPSVGAVLALGTPNTSGDDNLWLAAESAVRAGPGRVALPGYGSRRVDQNNWESVAAVVVADFANRISHRVDIDGSLGGDLFAVGSEVWTSHQESVPRTANAPAMSRFYVDRIDVSGALPVLRPRLNVPGSLVGVADGGRVLFTRDYQWVASDRLHHALAELTVTGDRARLRKYLPLDEGLGRIVVRDRHLYATTQSWWWARSEAASGVTLRAYASSDAVALHEVSRQAVGGYQQLREAIGGHLFLGSGYWGGPWYFGFGDDLAMGGRWGGGYYGGGNGLLVYGLASADRPAYQRFVRTNGWVQGLSAEANTLFVSGGVYGVQQVALAP